LNPWLANEVSKNVPVTVPPVLMPTGETFPPVAFTVMIVVVHDCVDCARACGKVEIKIKKQEIEIA
jgi:hypothetical protein